MPADFPIVNLGAWGNDPLAIMALKEKIDAAMERPNQETSKQAAAEY